MVVDDALLPSSRDPGAVAVRGTAVGTAIADPTGAERLFAALADQPDERLGCAYLDPEWRLLGLRLLTGGPDSIALPLRMIIGDALGVGATAMIVAHNHPSGNCAPSRADIDATRRLAAALMAVDIRLIDHLVLGRHRTTSMRLIGLL